MTPWQWLQSWQYLELGLARPGEARLLLLRRGCGLRHGSLRRCRRRGDGEQLANQRELGLGALVYLVERNGAVVFHAGEAGIDVAEVLVRDRVVGPGQECNLERPARLIVVALLRPDHRQVVVRLGQLRVILGQLLESGDRGIGLVLICLQHAFEESCLRVLRVGREHAVDLGQCRRVLAVMDQTRRLRQLGAEPGCSFRNDGGRLRRRRRCLLGQRMRQEGGETCRRDAGKNAHSYREASGAKEPRKTKANAYSSSSALERSGG